MAIKKSLTFDIFGKDKSASKTMKGVGKTADGLGKKMSRVGAGIAAGLAVAGAAAVAFGIDSVKAFAEAEEAQNELRFALERFPKAADTNIRKLGELNSALMMTTRFDDDAIASAQSLLLQYGLTGKQLEELTPLLLDYAARTGTDLPTAAESLGKSLMGQGRALKAIGIDFEDTGSVAGNFEQLVVGLREQVGGFAEQDAQTAAGKLEQLRNRFGEVQEKIGEALMPALDGLVTWIEGDGLKFLDGFTLWLTEDAIPNTQKLVDWVVRYKDILGPAAIALGTLTAAQWVLNAAMSANPVGIVIMGLAALITLATIIATNWDTVVQVVWTGVDAIIRGASGIALNVATAVQGVLNGLLAGVSLVLRILNPILSLVGLGPINIPVSVDFVSGLRSKIDLVNKLSGQIASGVKLSDIGIGSSQITQPKQIPGGRTYMATGGIVRPTVGGTEAVIGEAGTPEAVIPLSRSALERYGLGGGGDEIHLHLTGFAIGTEDELARKVTVAITRAKRAGRVSRRWNDN